MWRRDLLKRGAEFTGGVSLATLINACGLGWMLAPIGELITVRVKVIETSRDYFFK